MVVKRKIEDYKVCYLSIVAELSSVHNSIEAV